MVFAIVIDCVAQVSSTEITSRNPARVNPVSLIYRSAADVYVTPADRIDATCPGYRCVHPTRAGIKTK